MGLVGGKVTANFTFYLKLKLSSNLHDIFAIIQDHPQLLIWIKDPSHLRSTEG